MTYTQKSRISELLNENASLRAENERLRSVLRNKNTHECKRCFVSYTPGEYETEDCPDCFYNGYDPL